MKTDNNEWKEIRGRLETLFKNNEQPENGEILEILNGQSAEMVALALEGLDTEMAIKAFIAAGKSMAPRIIEKINPELGGKLAKKLDPAELEEILKQIDEKDAASILSQSSLKKEIKTENGIASPSVVKEASEKTKYRANQAGRLMTSQFVKMQTGVSVKECIDAIRMIDRNQKIPEDIFIVDGDAGNEKKHSVAGVISIRDLLSYKDDQIVDSVMIKDIVCVKANTPQRDAAALLSKYKFQTLPVVDNDENLVGVIPVYDLLETMTARINNLYNKATGTDAQKMEKLNSFQEAKLRVPWLLGTIAIELVAGLIISKFDGILQKVILLASFMPVISAVSGNVGLQAAAITVRAVDTKNPGGHNLWKAVRKEAFTSILMALCCGLVLGTVGAIWAKHIPFGIVIGGALLCSMLTAGIMGTIIPIFSKRFGFDPATTAGPFETAFQDIVGFGMFLWLATIFQDWIT